MPRYEGLVACLKEDGKAEVVIGPDNTGVPGASPQVNRRVCHCTTDGSSFMIEALNRVGAGVGDRVLVSRDAYGLAKNAAALLGLPVLGLISGSILGFFLTDGFSFRIAGGVIAIVVCLFSGMTIGVLIFRRVSGGSQSVIEHVIERRRKGDPLFSDSQTFSIGPNSGCNKCSGPF
jgi:hypothetical protein